MNYLSLGGNFTIHAVYGMYHAFTWTSSYHDRDGTHIRIKFKKVLLIGFIIQFFMIHGQYNSKIYQSCLQGSSSLAALPQGMTMVTELS
jgi:hypothetical protein